MLDTQIQTLVTLVIVCVNVTAPNELCGNEVDPFMRKWGEKPIGTPRRHVNNPKSMGPKVC
jgi:hypothetical protein